MRFSVYMPPQQKSAAAAGQKKAISKKFPFVTFLSGLTCNYENFTTKAAAYGSAATLAIAIIVPDTSPRGADIADDKDYDLGQGAGFYLNATQMPWARNYQMESYIANELNELVCHALPLDKTRQAIMGHSMGGHGALTLALKYPQLYSSVSAFSPIVAPSQVPWGRKAFAAYLGNDKAEWQKHDACALMQAAGDRRGFSEFLIDQGTADPFLEKQLKPELFVKACIKAGQKLELRMQPDYDHSYYFIQSFITDHLRHHAAILTH